MGPRFGISPGGPREGHGDRSRSPIKERSLAEISVTVWLTPENASFFEKNGLLWISLQEKEQRVTLCRQFPFDMLWEYISVMDEEQQEVGIIRNTALFEGAGRELLENELKKRYYAPTVTAVLSVKERYGYSHWRVMTEQQGEVKFTLHDTYRSILHVNDRHLIFSDVNGNRFDLPDAEALDAKSRRKLELYL